jgi:RNA polymerase sigma-70 factor (ECF subfamily)
MDRSIQNMAGDPVVLAWGWREPVASDPKSAAIPEPPSGRADDLRLLRAVAGGDGSALAALYDRYRGAVFGLCVRVLGRGPDAEEVLEDVFFELWRRAQEYDPRRASVAAYLMTLARSRAIDRVRARRRYQVAVAGAARETGAAGPQAQAARDPLDAAIADRGRAAATRALADLEPAEREVVELAFFTGLSHSEIAQRLELPIGTVKTRIRRAQMRMRESLERGSAGEAGE